MSLNFWIKFDSVFPNHRDDAQGTIDGLFKSGVLENVLEDTF